MWWGKVKLGNNLLIKSNKGVDLIIDYNQSSEYLFQICIKWGIRFRNVVIVGRKCGKELVGVNYRRNEEGRR